MDKDHPNHHSKNQERLDSIYRYIKKSATSEGDGVWWPAFDGPKARPQKEPGLYKGAAGVAYFLIDYHRATGKESPLSLAVSGLKWALRQEDTKVIDLGAGWAGIGVAYLQLAIATNDANALEIACNLGDKILTYDPGPVLQYPDRKDDRASDIFRGAAGEGLFLLRLYEATKEQHFLQGAIRNAAWLSEVAIRDDLGCHWTIYTSLMSEPPPINRYFGFCHGAAGIGHFLVQLFRHTKDANIHSLIQEIVDLFQTHALHVTGGLNWPMYVGEKEADRYQWCHGCAGIGLFLIGASDVLQDALSLQLATQASEAAYNFGDGLQSPIQCHGLSGNAELFLEMYRATGASRWLDRAHIFASLLDTYRVTESETEAWQSDEPGLTSVSYSCGAAGIGHFLLRLDGPDRYQMPFW